MKSKLDLKRQLAKHFMPHQIAWIEAQRKNASAACSSAMIPASGALSGFDRPFITH